MADLPHDLPERLRAAGLKVTAVPGWKRRGRPAYTGGFAPVGVLCHHTATTVRVTIAAVLRLLTGGRTGLPGPLSQLGLSRRGRVYIIAAGRANHAGHAKASGTVAVGDGNTIYVGIEAFNAGTGERWPQAQYDAYVLLCAVLCLEVTGNSHRTVRAHKETSTTGKIDPAGPTPYENHFDMDAFRTRVAAQIRNQEDDMPSPEDYARAVWRKPIPKTNGNGKNWPAQKVLRRAMRKAENAARRTNALMRRVKRIEQRLDKLDGGGDSGE